MNDLRRREDNYNEVTSPVERAYPKTIVASDNEVSNGFVSDGKKLPYVFEATESGTRKRSSKILPVCGVCGKRFVCVTTMKRHLVTHTGEKPFACKICGKQYTQKGNLRVHERTHRNDRPFECNICQQKFYRKEPMQKHQWRQHGIVHFKSRPPHIPTSNQQNPPTTGPIGIIGAEGVLYNSIVDRIKNNSLETFGESSRGLDGPAYSRPTSPRPSSHLTLHEDNVRHAAAMAAAALNMTTSRAPSPEPISSPSLGAEEDSKNAKFSPSLLLNRPRSVSSPPLSRSQSPAKSNLSLLTSIDNESRPMKLKKKLAHAWEVEERDRDNGLNLGELQLSPAVFTASEDTSSSTEDFTAKEAVECQCKTCGNVFKVLDPYNFRCNNCNVKYTSLPTHMIADPLQCIGCCQVFPHKPSLKAHQTCNDKERPFRCCKCGYGFRQKAHLQKHQWRIHRRKLEPDTCPKEAEMILQALNTKPSNFATITMQDIIDRGVEHSMRKAVDTGDNPQPLDLSPAKPLALNYVPPCSIRSNSPTPKLKDLVASLPSFSPKEVSEVRLIRESNPLLNQRPLNLQIRDPDSVLLDDRPDIDDAPVRPVLKKHCPAGPNHHLLPPLASLPKPPTTLTLRSPRTLLNPTDSDLPTTLDVTKPSELIRTGFMREHLEVLRSKNLRTV